MSSAVEKLLEAARYIEMQEMRQKRIYKIEIPGCTPPDSPITTSGHYTIHNIDYSSMNSSIVRVDGRSEIPFLVEHYPQEYQQTIITPPFIVIPSSIENHHQRINSNLNNQIQMYPNTIQFSPINKNVIDDEALSHSHSSTNSTIITASVITTGSASTANGTTIISTSGTNGNHVMHTNGEESSQSSLNLSSGYISGGSANSSVGGGSSLSLSGTPPHHSSSSSSTNNISPDNNHHHHHHLLSSPAQHQQPQMTTNRRRTISSNSNGGTQRSPCILRADTREVHNKLEKNRRAHLKDCFEQLKKELPYQDEKKTSNLSILGNAFRTVQSLKAKERELEHEMERLAKEKVAQQKKILILKRELSAHFEHGDSSFLLPENELNGNGNVRERFLSESEHSLPSTGRARYSSTSSLSSAATASSPCTAGLPTQSAMSANMSASNSPVSPHRPNSSSPTQIPLSLISVMGESSPLKITQMNGITTNGITHNGNHHIAINFTTNDVGVTPALQLTSATTNSPISIRGHHSQINVNGNQQSSQLLHQQSTYTNGVGSISTGQGLQIISTSNNNAVVTASTTSSPIMNGGSLTSSSSSSSVASKVLKNGIRTTIVTNNNNDGNIKSNNTIITNGGNLSSQHLTQQTMHNIISNGTTMSKDSTTAKLEIISPKMTITNSSTSSNSSSCEPPAKVIKLINGSIALASVVDKDSKLLSSNSLTLSQVVVSPLPLRVNGQPQNGMATIELSNPNGKWQRNYLSTNLTDFGYLPANTTTVQQRNNNTNSNHNLHHHQQQQAHTAGAQLHKLLVSGTTANLTSVNSVLTAVASSSQTTPEMARLPGGAELNILPAGTNGTSLYRSNGKLTAIVNNNGFTFKGNDSITTNGGTNGRAVHMVTPLQTSSTPISALTPIVVSQGQNGTSLTHIIASSPQLAGKVVTTPLSVNGQGLPIMGTQYLSTAMVKPMVVTVSGNGSNASGTITLPITTTTSVTGSNS